MKKIAKVKKDKPFKPYIFITSQEEGKVLMQVLSRVAREYEEDCKVNTKVIRDFVLCFAEKHTKRLIWSTFPLRIQTKNYEAMMLYKAFLYDRRNKGFSVFFDFIWDIDQNLIS